MMIGLYNLKKDMRVVISRKIETVILDDSSFPEIDCLLIDWIDKESPQEFAYQAALVNKYIKKGVRTVIYDRYVSITYKEYEWLSKFNVSFFEPSLYNRKQFIYLPHWIDPDDNKLLDIEEKTFDRSIDLGHKGNRNNESFEKYYFEYGRKYTNNVISYKDLELDWKNVKCMVAVDSDESYRTGNLNSHVVDALSSGCMVMLPIEHRWFVGLFRYNTIDNINDINYLLGHLDHTMRFGVILSLYENIRKRFPEFTLEYAVDTILSALEG